MLAIFSYLSHNKFHNIKVKIYFKLIISGPSTLILFCKELKYVSNDVYKNVLFHLEI